MRTRRSTREVSPDQLWLFPSLSTSTARDSEPPEGEAPAALRERIVTIPASEPFLPTLARALLDGTLPCALPGAGADSNAGLMPGALDLSATTLLLPTRRATRGLQDAFLEVSSARAVLLPTIRPIAEGDDDASLVAGLSNSGLAAGLAFDLPPAVGGLERLLVMTRLVMQWSDAIRAADQPGPAARTARATLGARTPAQAANLARELSRLVDMVETEAASLDGLARLVRDDFSEHWKQTLDFLEIVTKWWPAYLDSAGLVSAAERRNRLILAEARRLEASPPDGPVIVAGVTGSIPATVELMRTVSRLPNGAIVLPGLDLSLDENAWQAITGRAAGESGDVIGLAGNVTAGRQRPAHPEHPQFGLKSLLDRLGMTRADVAVLARSGTASASSAVRAERSRLVSEAMRPSAMTARWVETIAATDPAAAAAAIRDVTLIEAPTGQDEAEAIALILREAAETPGRTAALISPDRLLARRVAIRLEAWGIRVDDSAGRPLRKTPPGALLDLAITAAAEQFTPKPLMALLKHPLVRLGLDPFTVRRSARALEIAAFRAPYLDRGFDGVRAALEAAERDCALGPEQRTGRRPRAVTRLFPEDWQAAHALVARLERAFAPLTPLFATDDTYPLAVLAEAHARFGEALAAEPPPAASESTEPPPAASESTEPPPAASESTEPPPAASEGTEPHQDAASPLWLGEAGAAARALFDGLTRGDVPAPAIAGADYPDFYRALAANETVRPRIPVHARLSIWGPFEARLQQPDIVILGSLNDGTWPEAADPGPWLNRPMREQLGLPSPEQQIGYAAHDFTMALGASRVFLTRAQKIDGVPTVPSRWLMRLDAVLAGLGLAAALRASEPGSTYLAWARQRDEPGRWTPAARPQPRPPVELRPRRLSVSSIETWIANPYQIFASHILRLEPLPPLGSVPDASVRGSIVHAAMARFADRYPDRLPADIATELTAIAAEVLEGWTRHPRVAAFWVPRFERFARWFAETEPARRIGQVSAEVSGQMVLSPAGRPFTLTARADRLDFGAGGLIITDYKTGQPPSEKLVLSGRRPQLPLEAAIARDGGFGEEARTAIAGLRYIRASGGEPAGIETTISAADLDDLINSTLAGLERHIARFDRPDTPYAVTRRAQFSYDFDPYAQLGRVAEWSATGTPGGFDEDAP